MQLPMGDRTFRDDVVRLAALTVNTAELQGLDFTNCRIIGPGILIPAGSTSLTHIAVDGPLDDVFWEILPGRTGVTGAIDCTFSDCTFQGVRLAGPAALRKLLLQAGFSG